MKEEQKNFHKILKEVIYRYEEKLKKVNKDFKLFVQTISIKNISKKAISSEKQLDKKEEITDEDQTKNQSHILENQIKIIQ